MLLGHTLLLLMGLSACTVAGDEKPALGGTEARSWVTVTLEEGVIPGIQLQLQEVKRGRVSQFFGLMGKRVGGVPPIQPARTNRYVLSGPSLGHQRGQMVQDLPGRRGPSTEGRQRG
ncbi:tachykinin-4 isoform X2 [Sturnira hondurensis]|uniref:tachykinin-4 isoform X2 n=1 Tax=Sturnira hondurensis TaxID=192404 RepID=UPI001879283C|nr:tachykinin-4 isoform X2 [Sturnira hondurensis]